MYKLILEKPKNKDDVRWYVIVKNVDGIDFELSLSIDMLNSLIKDDVLTRELERECNWNESIKLFLEYLDDHYSIYHTHIREEICDCNSLTEAINMIQMTELLEG